MGMGHQKEALDLSYILGVPTTKNLDYYRSEHAILRRVSLTVIALRRPPRATTTPGRVFRYHDLGLGGRDIFRCGIASASPRVESSGQKPLTWRDLGGVRSVGRPDCDHARSSPGD
jgi:hypothetical protein